jgi:cytochrome c-type biogenesis protein CcmH/NrfG
MRYWTGLLIALVVDAAVIAGPDFVATEPQPARAPAVQWPVSSDPESLSFAQLQQVDRRVDSLMQHLREQADDVDAMLAVARIYTEQGWAGDAIGPLARALQLNPYRRDLWVALDRALERGGRVKITDAELTRAALEFVAALWVSQTATYRRLARPAVASVTQSGYILTPGGAHGPCPIAVARTSRHPG